MRIWYTDRTEAVVSDNIDFNTVRFHQSIQYLELTCHQDCKIVIHFFLAVMFASYSQLGWDPTMKRVAPNTFDITVRSEDGTLSSYRTIKMIAGVKAEALRGRATRVWTCNPLDDKGDIIEGSAPVVLKDTWIDEDREREGAIIERFRNANDPALRAILVNSLLTVQCHGDVFVDGEPDVTQKSGEGFDHGDSGDRFVVTKTKARYKQNLGKTYTQRMEIASPLGAPAKAPNPMLPYHKKVHYRCVFKEVGTPLHMCCSLRTVYKALGDVVAGDLLFISILFDLAD